MNTRDRRALRIGGAVIVAGLLCFRLLPAGWRMWRGAEEELADRRAVLSRAESLIASMPTVDSAATDVRKRFVALAPRLVSGGSAAEAQAALGSLVGAIADRSALRVRQVGGASDSAEAGPLRRVGVSLELEGDWAGVDRFWRGVVREPVALSVGRVQVTANDPTSPADRPEVLVLRAELHGWYLPKEGR